MKAVISARHLQDTLTPVSGLLDETVLTAKEHGIRLQGRTQAEDASVATKVPAEAFDQYAAKDDTTGFNIERVASFLQLLTPSLGVPNPSHRSEDNPDEERKRSI